MPEFGTELAKASTCTENGEGKIMSKQNQNTVLLYHIPFSGNVCINRNIKLSYPSKAALHPGTLTLKQGQILFTKKKKTWLWTAKLAIPPGKC